MTYQIKYNEIEEFTVSAKKQIDLWNDGIDGIGQSLSNFIGDMGMTGKTADSVQCYLEEIHYTLLATLQQLMIEYYDKLISYQEGYQNIDTSGEAVLTEDTFENIVMEINTKDNDFEMIHMDIVRIIRGIDDICDVSIPFSETITNSLETMKGNVLKLNSDVGEYEESHVPDCDYIREFMGVIKGVIDGQSGKDSKVTSSSDSLAVVEHVSVGNIENFSNHISNYVRGSITKDSKYKALVEKYAFSTELMDIIEEIKTEEYKKMVGTNFTENVMPSKIMHFEDIMKEAFKRLKSKQKSEYLNSNDELGVKDILEDLEWPNINEEFVEELNKEMKAYGITDELSIKFFLATIAEESGRGDGSGEKGDGNYFEGGNDAKVTYVFGDRGTGYMQLTHKDMHLRFLETQGYEVDYDKKIFRLKEDFKADMGVYASDGVTFIPNDVRLKAGQWTDCTVDIIAKKYPVKSAAWFWASGEVGKETVPNEYVVLHKDKPLKGVYMVAQYHVNGWPNQDDYPNGNADLETIRNGAPIIIEQVEIGEKIGNDGKKTPIMADRLLLGGKEYVPPTNWPSRENYFNMVMGIDSEEKD